MAFLDQIETPPLMQFFSFEDKVVWHFAPNAQWVHIYTYLFYVGFFTLPEKYAYLAESPEGHLQAIVEFRGLIQ